MSSELVMEASDSSPNIFPTEILRALTELCEEDFRWDRLIQQRNLAVLPIWYEDLATDFNTQMQEVLKYLGIDTDNIPQPPTKKQAGPLNDAVRRDFMAYLGVTGEHPISS
jgi:LPS sulfotransferase NodH